jgi:hypothetical protein
VEQTEYCYRPPIKQVSGISAVNRVQPGVIYEKAVVTAVKREVIADIKPVPSIKPGDCPPSYECLTTEAADKKWGTGGYWTSQAWSSDRDVYDQKTCTNWGATPNQQFTDPRFTMPSYCSKPKAVVGDQDSKPVVLSPLKDTDNDGAPDSMDNCRYVYNQDQADADHDGIGNACDNCWDIPNLDQKDVKDWCHHLIFVSEYFDPNRNAWIKDPACGDACTRPELNKDNPDTQSLVLARQAGNIPDGQPAGGVQPVPAARTGFIESIAGVFFLPSDNPLPPDTGSSSPTRQGFIEAIFAIFSPTAPKSVQDIAGTCPSGQTMCGVTCIDTAVDSRNCGTCGIMCDSGKICSYGVCVAGQVPICASGMVACDKGCTDIRKDASNCGGCGWACPANTDCYEGMCHCKVGYQSDGVKCNPVAAGANNTSAGQGEINRYAGMENKVLNPQPVPPL